MISCHLPRGIASTVTYTEYDMLTVILMTKSNVEVVETLQNKHSRMLNDAVALNYSRASVHLVSGLCSDTHY